MIENSINYGGSHNDEYLAAMNVMKEEEKDGGKKVSIVDYCLINLRL